MSHESNVKDPDEEQVDSTVRAATRAEVPVLALARLPHLRIALTRGVLGRRWGGDNRGIDDRARLQKQSLLLQKLPHLGKHRLGQLVLLQLSEGVSLCTYVRHPTASPGLAVRSPRADSTGRRNG